jgi:O-acetyl-ADP-ribose deacetylase (regulator of RNase III)
MITVLADRDVFESPADTIVNPVNCVGVMGKGLALAVKQRYPVVFEKYLAACESGKMHVGKLQLVRTFDRRILNFPTKKHWRGASKLEFIEAGLKTFARSYRRKRISSIAFPPLGCGHGGLDWGEVEPLMRKHLEPLTEIEVYFCLGNKASQLRSRSDKPKKKTREEAEPRQTQLWDGDSPRE